MSTLLITVLCIWLCNKVFFYRLDSFVFAWVLHFLLMSWYAFSLPYLKLEYKGSYYDIKPIEGKGKIYTYFGVNIFRWILKRIGWNKTSDKQNGEIVKSVDRLKRTEQHTREAELAHGILFLHFLVISFYFLPSHNVFWLLLLNIILHIYPVFVQRYNRPRYLKLIAKLDS